MTKTLRLGSLFDGSGGFPLAATKVGIEPVWASEIEPFPILVTTTRLPQMQHLGDICDIDGSQLEPVDVVTFGSPCQDLSVAGKRAGLAGERSGLFHQAVRVIKEMREASSGRYPRFAVWENVPGAFSSNKGADFHSVLQNLISVVDETAAADLPRVQKWHKAGAVVADQWSIAWRVLDAQFFGVPQRRKRIYLICDFASGRAGHILFEPTRLHGDLAQGCSEKQNPPTNPRAGTHEASKSLDVFALRMRAGKPGGGKGPLVQTNLSGTLGCSNDQSIIEPLLFDHHPHDARVGGPCQIAPTVTARYGTGGGNTPIIATAYGFNALHEGRGAAVGRYGYPTEVSKTLDTSGITPTCNQGGIAIMQPDVISASKSDFFCRGNVNIAGALLASDPTEPPLVTDPRMPEYRVRRLTPTECARLQGFPDTWTDGLAIENPSEDVLDYWWQVWANWAKTQGLKKPKTRNQVRKWLANPVTDRALYKLWGNGIALPCAELVLSQIVAETTKTPGF
ncbi:DNA cytosine methyltransferase [Mobiluncus curtisii]|uniref:Cytosine-specific methyltransferase n=2 Tax=Actinomycetaceae TaxID=2049 RepID=E6LY15_9ACTO|nr:DNA (cytosine-5-)-methyltransferase [Mobiluncus curtisii]EFU80532.1 DNA (cytosine-5-)-methyltransferase [Mobiluncus curtisii ATCC 51333]